MHRRSPPAPPHQADTPHNIHLLLTQNHHHYDPMLHLPRMWQPQHHPPHRRLERMLRLRIFLDRPPAADTLTHAPNCRKKYSEPARKLLRTRKKNCSESARELLRARKKPAKNPQKNILQPLQSYNAPTRILQRPCTVATRPLYGQYKALVVFVQGPCTKMCPLRLEIR